MLSGWNSLPRPSKAAGGREQQGPRGALCSEQRRAANGASRGLAAPGANRGKTGIGERPEPLCDRSEEGRRRSAKGYRVGSVKSRGWGEIPNPLFWEKQGSIQNDPRDQRNKVM